MNKRKVDSYLENAVQVLADAGIVQNGEIQKAYRGQLSSFGATIVMGSVLSAVAVYADKSGSETDTEKLMSAIYMLKHFGTKEYESIKNADPKENAKKLFEYVKDHYAARGNVLKEEIMEYAVALKLAMNLYHLKK